MKQNELEQIQEKLIRDFLEDGTKNLCGDLSVMVSHIVKAFKAGQEQAVLEERKFLKMLDKEFDMIGCGCGEDWKDCDMQYMVKDRLKSLTNKEKE